MKRFSFILALCAIFVTGLNAADDHVTHVDADKAAKLVEEGKVTILDVRTAEEFSEGHIKGAKNADIMSKGFIKDLEAVDKKKPVLVHCQAGGRSTRSLPALEKAGFLEIYHLDGGMADWIKAGKPVVK